MPAYRGPDGKIVYASDEDAGRFEAGGYQRVGEAAAGEAQNRIAPVDNGIAGSIGATVSAGLSGATLGASDWLLKGVLDKGQFEQLAQDRADNPGLSGAAQFAGAFLPAVVSGGTATPSGYLSHLAAEGIGSAEATGGALGAAKSLAIAGGEGAFQNAGVYLSDVALGDRDLTAEGMAGALGTGFAFGGGGLIAGHGISAGTTAARRMFARYAAGGEEAAQAAQSAWQEQSAKALESFDQAADAAKAQLQEAQLARQQADLARKQAAAAVAEAKVAPPPEVAGPGPVAGAPDQPPGDVELAGMMRDRAMAATDPQRMAAWDAQNGQRLQELMAARTPTGEVGLAEPSAPTATAIARRTDDLNGLMSQLKAMSAPQEAELASKLSEYQAARDAFHGTHAAVDPDLDDVLRSTLGVDVQREPVPVGEFGAPGARGYKPGEVAAPGPPSQAPLAGGAEGTPVTRALRKGAAGEPTKAFDFEDSGLTFDPGTRQYTTAEPGAGASEPLMAQVGDKYNAAGGVIVNGEGKIAIVKTKGGGEWVLPKGRIDPGEAPAQAARREVLEESGAHAEIGPHIGDYEGNHSNTRFYLMRHAGDDLSAMAKDGEMSAVKFVTPDEAEKLLSHPMNKRALADARKMLDEQGADFWAGAHVSGNAVPLSSGEFDKYAQEWQSKLSPEAKQALERYSRNGTFSLINAPLRKAGDIADVESGFHGLVADMDKAVASAPAPREMLTFRGVNGRRSTAQWGGAEVGDVIVDHGFGSTSVDPAVGESFAKGLGVRDGVLLKVTVPKGYPAAPVPSEIFGSERELLLPRNTKYTVTKVETVPGGRVVHVTASAAAPGERSAVGAALVPTDINDMNLKQLDAHMSALEERKKELDFPGKRGPELDQVRKDLGAAYDRHSAIRKGQIKEPSGVVAKAAPTAHMPEDDLLSALQGTKSKLDAGESLVEMGAPARAAYKATKAEKTAAAAEHFRAKAKGAAPDDGGDLLSALQGTSEGIGAGKSLREIGGAPMVSERAVAVKRLEMAHDDALERASAATEPAEKAAAQAEAKAIEQQMTAVGKKPGAVEDVAAMAPVVHRLEKAAADLTEALGDVAPAAAKEHAAAFRQAEDVASEKSAARVARAADDHVTAREQAQADDLVGAPSAKDRAVAAAKRQRAEAEAAYQKARVAEAEASIGAKRAVSAANEARESMPPPPSGSAPASRGIGGRIVSGAHAIGYAAELGSDLGIPGIPRPHDIPVIGPLLSAYLKYRAFRAAAGRFVGRIPATAETKAAELAARTRDGIARSMDRSLGLIERNPTAVRAALTLGAVQASKALSKRLIDDGKPDAADGASVSALAAVRMREVAAAVANPALISDLVRKQTRDVVDPGLIQALENHLQSVFAHLNDTAPKGPPPNPLTKQDWKPPTAAATQWAQRVAVANNPQVAFDLLEAGKLTPAAADTLRICYQKLFAEAQQRLAQRAADLEHPVPYRQLMQAGLLFDTATHPSLDPENATVMQQAHVAPPQPTPQPSAPPVPGIAAPTNLTSLYQTTADRRASR